MTHHRFVNKLTQQKYIHDETIYTPPHNSQKYIHDETTHYRTITYKSYLHGLGPHGPHGLHGPYGPHPYPHNGYAGAYMIG